MNRISNRDSIIDSRDVIARIEELEGFETYADDEQEELDALKALAMEAEASPDWSYGETLIRHDYFVEYIKELVEDCYRLPKEFNSGEWPWRHMKMDWNAAADEARTDYNEVTFAGVDYLIRG